MLTPVQLFLKRLLAHGKFQWSVLRLVVDWIVALYIIVPVLLIAGYQYYSWWSAAPDWISGVPYLVVVLVLYRLSTMGAIRLFVEDADQLFLLQSHRWLPQVKRLGMVYSLIFHALLCAAVIGLLSPLLVVHYLLTPGQLVMLFLYMLVFRCLSAYLKHFISLRYIGWRFWFGAISLQLVMTAIFVYTLESTNMGLAVWSVEMVLFGCLAYFLARYRLHLKGTFARDIDHEQTQRLRFLALLLRGKLSKKTQKPRMKPIAFARSNHIFKQRTTVNLLIELYLKSFIRSGIQLKYYLQFLAAGSIVLAIPASLLPPMFKVILWLLLAIFLGQLLKAHWNALIGSSFVQMFDWKESELQDAAQKAIFYVMLPGYALLSLSLGISSFPLATILGLLLIGCLIAYMMSSLLVTMTFKKQGK